MESSRQPFPPFPFLVNGTLGDLLKSNSDRDVHKHLIGLRRRVCQEVSDKDINRLVGAYSTQRIVGLNLNETFSYKLKSGAERVIRLVSVKEQRDSVTHFVRRADVRVEIDGRPLDLVCAPYVMPTETARAADAGRYDLGLGKRVEAGATLALGRRRSDRRYETVRLPAAKLPALLARFAGVQRAGASRGRRRRPGRREFYHDYGFDMAGYEGREEVVSATAGKVVMFWPSREDICSVVIQDDGGFHWEYAHLKLVRAGNRLECSRRSRAEARHVGPERAVGQFLPSRTWVPISPGTTWTLTTATNGSISIRGWSRRIRRSIRRGWWRSPGRTIRFSSARRSISTARTRWRGAAARSSSGDGSFPTARRSNKRRPEKKFDRPGAYVAALWVKDDKGGEDVDFCQVKVYSRPTPEPAMPHIFMTYTPTENIRPNQPVTFRFWFQGSGGGPIKVDFDDGTQLADYRSYAELQHGFKTPGVHVVTAQCEADGKPIMQKLKVVVESE